jgi:hypothetical protein
MVNRVFIIGAGFSRAISEYMPLMGGLQTGVQSDLNSRGVEIGNDLEAIDNVEHWLTLLADPAPWLGASEQMRNAALFNDVSRAIYNVLTAMEIRAAVEPAPPWLLQLVAYWLRVNATVISFNYDGLVELAYLDVTRGQGVRWPWDLFAIPVTPAWLREGGTGRQRRGAFRLLKLHGSLDWWYSGPDAEQSDPIYWLGWTGHFGEGMAPLWADWGAEQLVEDKLPMLVPPAATKTPFYKNRLLAAQWVQAAAALRAADELVLMGYSAPGTDLTVTSLIATQFKGKNIVPVNPDKDIIQRAKELGDRRNMPTVDESFVFPLSPNDPSPLEKWVDTFGS